MKLYDHQKQALTFALDNYYTLNALQPGMGKTAVAINLALSVEGRCLIIPPAYLVSNWWSEIKLWAEGKERIFDIVPYSLIHKITDVKDYDVIVFDEAHYVKNLEAKRTRVAHELVSNGAPKYLLLMTGTPVKNGIPEIYSLLKLLSYGPYHFPVSYTNFCTKFCHQVQMRIKGRMIRKWEGFKNEELFHRLIKPIYYKGPEVALDMPDQVRKKVLLDLITDKFLAGAGPENAKHFSTQKADNATAKARVGAQYIQDLYNEVDKIVVFSDHIASLELLKEVFKDALVITGATPMSSREVYVGDFTRRSRGIILASIGAASTGINLQSANHMVFIDYPWSPSDIDQAEKRIHRIGQTKKCFYHYLLSGKIDEYILNLIDKKRDTIRTATDYE